jgi:hypothetical protein
MMNAIRILTKQRQRVCLASIVLGALLAAACTAATPEAVSSSGVSSPSPSSRVVDRTPAPSSSPTVTSPIPGPEPRAPENSGTEPFGLSDAAAERIDGRLTMGRGEIQGAGTWTLFLYRKGERVGVGFQIGDGKPTMACCLARLHSLARPLAFIPIRNHGGVVLAHIDPHVGRVRYDCIQCNDARGFFTYIMNGRLIGVPQLALVFVRPNPDGGNDGNLVTFGAEGRIDRDWIGLPPFCSGPPCPNGLAWGSIGLGTSRFFGP